LQLCSGEKRHKDFLIFFIASIQLKRISPAGMAKSNSRNNAECGKEDGGNKENDILEHRLRRCLHAEEVFSLCEMHVDSLNHINISTAMNRLAKILGCFSEIRPKGQVGLTVRQERTCKIIYNRSVTIVNELDPQSISTLVWALAALNMPSVDLLDGMGVITRRVISVSTEFKPLDLSDLMWGLAMLRLPAERELVKALSDHAVKIIDCFHAQHLSRLMWAVATLKIEICIELAKAVSRRAVDTVRDFKPVHISQLMWAYAKLEYFPGNDLVGAMLKRADEDLDGFLRQNKISSDFLWAIDKLGIQPNKLLADALYGRQPNVADIKPVASITASELKSPAPSKIQSAQIDDGPFITVNSSLQFRPIDQGAEACMDKFSGQGRVQALLQSKSDASGEDSLVRPKRKRDIEDERLQSMTTTLWNDGGTEFDTPTQKYETPENHPDAGFSRDKCKERVQARTEVLAEDRGNRFISLNFFIFSENIFFRDKNA
jgi:hypothetical protein